MCSVDWQQAPDAEQDAGDAAAASSCLGCATRHQLHERLSDLSRTAAPTSYLPRLTRASACIREREGILIELLLAWNA